jgi:isopenicillin N synthase-like dioxygenase
MSLQPAVIDVSGLVDRKPGALARVAAELEKPCTEWGAFQIVGHGVPQGAATAVSIRSANSLGRPVARASVTG